MNNDNNFRFYDRSLPVDERVRALLEELTIDEKLSMLTTFQRPIERLGLKGFMIGAEVARGLVCRGRSEEVTTVFPEPFGLAATFDPEIMHRMGEITGIESRIYNRQGKTSLCVWGPTVDPERDPRWGRNEEAYGEDPCLIGEMSKAYSVGMAGDDAEHLRVLPMLKHFYANNNEENRGSDNASLPHCLKHDYYLKSFETAIKDGGAKGVMTSYNEINGVEALCNPELDVILKKQWGMLFSVTDGGDFMMNLLSHKSDESYTETAARVYKNHGADIMTDNGMVVAAAAKNALDKGLISEADIDSALFGVFKARFLLGEIEGESKYANYPDELIACEDFYKASERAAVESVILLRNRDNLLPLSKEKTTAIIGVHADMNFRDWYTGLSDRNDTIFDVIKADCGDKVVYDSGNDIIAIKNPETGLYYSVGENNAVRAESGSVTDDCLFELFEWGEGKYSFRSVKTGKFLTDNGILTATADEAYGWFVHEQFEIIKADGGVCIKNWQKRFVAGKTLAVTADKRPKDSLFEITVVSDGLERVSKLCKNSEQAVLFCGNHPLINAREGYDRRHLELPERADKLMSGMLDVNINSAMFIVSGYPYALHDERLKGVMHICHAGPALGTAVCKTLFGEVSPAGRCPITWYQSADELRDIKDYNIISTKSTYLYYPGKPLFPFGHGLSYTEFVYGGLKLEKTDYSEDESAEVRIDVTNIGSITADEVVELYIAAPRFSRAVPIKELKAFKRVNIRAGETKEVCLSFPISSLGRWDENSRSRKVFSGAYKIMVGASSEDIRCCGEIKVSGEEYSGLDVSKPIGGAASYSYIGCEFDTDKSLNEYIRIADWQSFADYENCLMKGYSKAEIVAATDGGGAEITISCLETGQQVANFRIPGSDGKLTFTAIQSPATPIDGVYTLRVTGSGALKSFRFYN